MPKATNKEDRVLSHLVRIFQYLHSRERKGSIVSISEISRMLKNHSILINETTDWNWDDEMPKEICQLVAWPKSKRKVTFV